MSIRSPEGEEFFPIDEAAARRVISEGLPVVTADCAGNVLAIKEGETFLVSSSDGSLDEGNACGHGLYHQDTRFLSHFTLRVNGAEPILLSSSAERAFMSHMDLTNPDIWDRDTISIPQQTVNVRRIRVVGDRLHERIRVKNYSASSVELSVQIELAADFEDIFEVRGLRRTIRGTVLQPKLTERGVVFAYLGQDDLFRQTRVEFSHDPQTAVVRGGRVSFAFSLPLRPHQTRLLGLTVEPLTGSPQRPPEDFDTCLRRSRRSYEAWEHECTQISTNNELFNSLLERGRRDMRALYTRNRFGGMIAAGIPWYVAPFGRDSILAAYEILSLNPRVSAETLRLLAALQGRQLDPWRDEEPGKIFHELRQGELAFSNLIPHTPYYGTVDATPLFLMLAGAYFRWTNDLALMEELKPALVAALSWIDDHGDSDGDGFVEYERKSPRGLENQGWKDSGNSIVHTDGTLAKPPIALAEVQAYVYMAKSRIAEIFSVLGDDDLAERLRKEAAILAERFNRDFWMPEHNYFALALDGDKRQVETVTSNPGHGLYCGIIEPDKARAVAARLLEPDMFSGWGIRTMSKGAVAYNPMSYHNGSVWPHDNAIIAAGLKRYGFRQATERVLSAIFETAVQAEYMRLPELFCGFTRRSPNSPVSYPVACSPQAWAAGSVFFLIQAMLGISARAHENLLTVNDPGLPPWLGKVEIANMRVGSSSISLLFTRDGDVTSFSLVSKEGDVRVVMEE
ncbi:MAG TPA: amylo-alpha-1,6-glucosidase [Actinomycetota bacterium]|nr:amylo-alpha-1,6-glucosidase [Actinomycetota bacterium]